MRPEKRAVLEANGTSQAGKGAPPVSVVVLTFNSAEHILACLDSLSQACEQVPGAEVIVVDNASSDETCSLVRRYGRRVRLVINRDNLGCAGGNNIGWRAARGEIVVFVNPDVVVTPGWLEQLLRPFGEDPHLGIAGSKLYYPGGRTIQHMGGILYPNGMVDHWGKGEEDWGQYDDLSDVDYVTGAAMAVRRELLEQLGGFDEDYYPAYFEETDLCWRARRKGWAVRVVPEAVAYHHESTILQRRSPRFLRYFYKARMRFVAKNYTWREWLFTWLPAELIWLTTPHARGGRLRQLRAYAQAIRFAWRRRKTATQGQ